MNKKDSFSFTCVVFLLIVVPTISHLLITMKSGSVPGDRQEIYDTKRILLMLFVVINHYNSTHDDHIQSTENLTIVSEIAHNNKEVESMFTKEEWETYSPYLKDVEDAWGIPIRAEVVDLDSIHIISNGRDRLPNTSDDISMWLKSKT